MATLPKTELQPKKIVITGQTVDQQSEIFNHDSIEFEVKNFQGKKFCGLQIYAVTYTDDGVTEVPTMKITAGPTPQPLGTIKIHS